MFEGESSVDPMQDFSHVYVCLQNTLPYYIPIKYTNGVYVGGYGRDDKIPAAIGWFSQLSSGGIYGRFLTEQDSATNDAISEKYASKYIPDYVIHNNPSPWIETGMHFHTTGSNAIELQGMQLADNDGKLLAYAYVMLDTSISDITAPEVLSKIVEEAKAFGDDMQLSSFSDAATASPLRAKQYWRLAISQGKTSDSLKYVDTPVELMQPGVGEKTIFSDTLLKPWDIQEASQTFFNPIVQIGNYQTVCNTYLTESKQLSTFELSAINIPVLPGQTCIYADLFNLSSFAFTLPWSDISAGNTPTEQLISAYLGNLWNPATSDYQLIMRMSDTGMRTY